MRLDQNLLVLQKRKACSPTISAIIEIINKGSVYLFCKNLIYKFRMRTGAIFTGSLFFVYDLELTIDIYHGLCV